MPLTRAQLLMGNSAQGVILNDQVQGVREAAPPDGITIATDGTIHFDSASSTGTMKMNNPSAYNGYVWPTAKGGAGQQLETDASGNLFWADADGIDWTGKGELIVGTGVGTDMLLLPGPNNRVLKTAIGAPSGLEWSELYVDVVPNLQGAAAIPFGTTAQRPTSPQIGYTRFNTTFSQPGRLEVFDDDGSTWRQLAYIEPRPILGDVTYSINTTVSGTVYCNNFTVNPGVTVTVDGAIFVMAIGFVNIQGSINVDGRGPNGGPQSRFVLGPAEAQQTQPGQGLGAGASRFPGQKYTPAVSPTGSGGGAGAVGNTSLSSVNLISGTGGNGGGSIIIRSLESITINGGVLSANGTDGFISTPSQSESVSGPGGGSGGTIVVDANRDIILNGALIQAKGGAGSAGINRGNGGGGGGGGYIITQARFGVLNIIGATSRLVTGGGGGAFTPNGVSNYAGGGSGSNGGKGGIPQNNALGQAAEPGEIGVISNYGSVWPTPV